MIFLYEQMPQPLLRSQRLLTLICNVPDLLASLFGFVVRHFVSIYIILKQQQIVQNNLLGVVGFGSLT
jgi:hypothetical protein